MWTTKVRLSLLGVVVLPTIFFLALTKLHQEDFASHILQLVVLFFGPGLLLGLLAGFIRWSSKALRGVFIWTSVVWCLAIALASFVNGYPLESFRHWGAENWAWFLPFFGLWLVVAWCTWILLRDVARPLLFTSAREGGGGQSVLHPPIASAGQQTRPETQEELEARHRALDRFLEDQKRTRRAT